MKDLNLDQISINLYEESHKPNTDRTKKSIAISNDMEGFATDGLFQQQTKDPKNSGIAEEVK